MRATELALEGMTRRMIEAEGKLEEAQAEIMALRSSQPLTP
jgi:hypothetical protein